MHVRIGLSGAALECVRITGNLARGETRGVHARYRTTSNQQANHLAARQEVARVVYGRMQWRNI